MQNLTSNNLYDYRASKYPIQDWFKIVEGFSTDFVENRLQKYAITSGARVLDPFGGAGTTALVCKYKGVKAISIDANPWMCLVASAKTTWDIDLSELKESSDFVLSCIPIAHIKNEELVGFQTEDQGKIFAVGVNPIVLDSKDIPALPRLEKKMSPNVLRKVLFLKEIIQKTVQDKRLTDTTQRLLWATFGAHLMRVSNMTWYGPKVSWKKKFLVDAPVFTLFRDLLRKVYTDLNAVRVVSQPHAETEVILGDARQVDTHVPSQVDLAITSPPYMNEACYTDQSQFELFFLGFVRNLQDLRNVKRRLLTCNTKYIFSDTNDGDQIRWFDPVMRIHQELVRNEKREEKRWGWNRPKMLLDYFGGMKSNLESVFKVLRKDARYDLIIGDSAIGGIHIPTDELVAKLAIELGYSRAAVEPFRKRQSSRDNTQLRESIVTLTN